MKQAAASGQKSLPNHDVYTNFRHRSFNPSGPEHAKEGREEQQGLQTTGNERDADAAWELCECSQGEALARVLGALGELRSFPTSPPFAQSTTRTAKPTAPNHLQRGADPQNGAIRLCNPCSHLDCKILFTVFCVVKHGTSSPLGHTSSASRSKGHRSSPCSLPASVPAQFGIAVFPALDRVSGSKFGILCKGSGCCTLPQRARCIDSRLQATC